MYFQKNYETANTGNYDIYAVFVQKSLELLNLSGKFGFILPHKFFNAKYGVPLRSLLSRHKQLREIVYFGDQQVFPGATTYTCLLFVSASANDSFGYVRVDDLDAWRLGEVCVAGDIEASMATPREWNFVVGEGAQLFKRLSAVWMPLASIAYTYVGLQTSADSVFLFKDATLGSGELTTVHSAQLGEKVEIESAVLKRVLRSGHIDRYTATPTALVLFPYRFEKADARLISEKEMASNFPLAWAYLLANRSLLSGREHGKFKKTGWYQLYPKNLAVWEQPKVMLPYMVQRQSAYYDEDDYYFVNVTTGGFGLTLVDRPESLLYVTGLLNSRLLNWYLKIVSTTFHGGYFAANKQFLDQLPIRTIDFDDPEDVARHDKTVELVETMLELHQRLAQVKTPRSRERLQRQITATDQAIDKLVYELYDLTDEEIAIVKE